MKIFLAILTLTVSTTAHAAAPAKKVAAIAANRPPGSAARGAPCGP